ncbi:methyltransferase domain-containing protein [Candidatus Woesearchaeota archaeon]|nr:methyltransferase domain-containing protein [Candidatus Woesearchaeota archaeon]
MTYYDDIAEGYEELHKEEQEKKIAVIKKVMKELNWKIKENETVLDVACGTGLTTRPWPGKKTGLDPARKLLEKAKGWEEWMEEKKDERKKEWKIEKEDKKGKKDNKKNKKIKYILGKAEHMPFKNHVFNWVLSITAVQNFNDINKALSEIKRVGKNHFILSFLKKSEKKESIEKVIEKKFKIQKKIEEEKDIIYFLNREV